MSWSGRIADGTPQRILRPMTKNQSISLVGVKLAELRKLLRQGVHPDTGVGEHGTTPLTYACFHRNRAVAKELIAAGADVNRRGFMELTPLTLVSGGKKPWHLELVTALLAAGADPNRGRQSDGRSPLESAAREGSIEIVKALLAAGADVNLVFRNGYQETALHCAVRGERLDVIKVLLAAGADPRIKTGRKFHRERRQKDAFEFAQQAESAAVRDFFARLSRRRRG